MTDKPSTVKLCPDCNRPMGWNMSMAYWTCDYCLSVWTPITFDKMTKESERGIAQPSTPSAEDRKAAKVAVESSDVDCDCNSCREDIYLAGLAAGRGEYHATLFLNQKILELREQRASLTTQLTAAQAERDQAVRDIETGFMPGAYARLKQLQQAEADLHITRTVLGKLVSASKEFVRMGRTDLIVAVREAEALTGKK